MAEPVWAAWRGLDRRVWQMAFARAVNVMGLSLVMSFLGIYVVEGRGYAAWVYGLIALGANLGQSLSSAWAGDLSDRIGRRPLITTTLFVRSVVIAALGTQVFLHAPLWSLALTMVMSSALRGCFEPVAYALVADVVRDDQRIAAFGLQRMGTNLGWAIGPALGGVLTLVMPYGMVFYLAAAAQVAAGVVTLRVVDPVPRHRDAGTRGELIAGLRAALADRALRLFLIATFLSALLQTQMATTLAIYVTDELGLHKADVGLLYTINGAFVLVLQLPALRFVQRLGIARALPLASLFEAIGFALVGAGSGFAGAALAMVAITGAEVVFNPAHQTAVADLADPAHRGRMYGIVTFAQMVGLACAPLLGGVVLDAIGHHHVATWVAIASIGVVQTICFIGFLRRRRFAAAAPACPV